MDEAVDTTIQVADTNRPNFVGKNTSMLILVFIVCFIVTMNLAHWITYDRLIKLPESSVLACLCVLLILCIILMVFMYVSRNNENYFISNRQEAGTSFSSRIHLPMIGIHIFGIGSMALAIAKIVLIIRCFSYTKEITSLLFHLFSTAFFFIEMQFLRKLHGFGCNNAKLRFLLLILLATNISVWFYTLMEESHEVFTFGYSAGMASGVSDDLKMACFHRNTTWHKHVQDMNPYLYPFIMEYCLLAAAEIAGIWWVHTANNTGNGDGHNGTTNNRNGFIFPWNRWFRSPAVDEGNPLLPNRRRGKFRHLAYVALCFSLILIIIEAMSSAEGTSSSMVNAFYWARLIFNVILMVVDMAGCFSLRKITLKKTKGYTSNDIMLLISVAGECLYLFFGAIACIGTLADHKFTQESDKEKTNLQLAYHLITLVEVFFQSRLLNRGSRIIIEENNRNSWHSFFQELLGYVGVCDLCAWIANSFIEGKLLHSDMANPTPNNYYGDRNWMLITKILYPFYIFYRLHAFVMCWEIASRM